MSWNNNQQPNLPYSAEQPQRGPFNIALNNPPYVPGNYQGPPILQQILPTVAAACALEIQNNARKNPLRTFMFNQYSRAEGTGNAFANPDFDALVHATMEYITLEMNQNRYGNVEQAAQNCVPQMCEMLCAINLRIFPDLEAYINQNVAQTLRNTIGQFDRIAQQIGAMRNQNQGGGWSSNQGSGGGWGNNNWGSGGGGFNNWGNNSGGTSNQPVNNRWSNSGGWGNSTPRPSTGSGNTGLFNGQDRRHGTSSGSSAGGSRWNDEVPNVVKQPYQSRDKESIVNHSNQQETQHQEQPFEASATSGLIKWVPSAKYPYLFANAPSTGELWLRQHLDGTIEPFLKEKDETPMEYDVHATGKIFGDVPRGIELKQAAQKMAKIEDGIRELNKATAAPAEDKEKPEVTTFIAPNPMVETSLDAAWLVGALERLTVPQDKLPDVYRTYFRIAQPIITPNDESELLKSFAASATFIDLRNKIQAAITEGCSEGLWSRVNDKLTAMINRIMKQKLAVDVTIDSFLGDIEALPGHLRNTYGQTVQQAFLKNERAEIQAAFILLDNGTTDEMTKRFLDERAFPNDAKPVLTYLTSAYTLTYMNLLSYELDIDLMKDRGSLVTDTLTPVLYLMLDGLFQDVSERSIPYERHLFQTNDGRILEAARGYLGEKSFILTLVK